ncbi:sensor histidine kinase [Spongiimicrobium sp. 2-473A-2-J]|uniref:sensor histidine kinase n=1 Tax=Eudoraea algarum TaxID=3417568 RepID=UPI003D362C4F
MRSYSPLIFCLILHYFATYGASPLDDYLHALKTLDYKSAMEHAKGMGNAALQRECQQLVDVLHNPGQERETFVLPYQDSDEVGYAVFLIKKGLYLLYTDPYRAGPFELLNEAYRLAQELRIKELEKLALLSILRVYNNEFSQSNDDKTTYLDRFEQLIDTPEDAFHFRINLLHYNLKNVFYKVELNADFAREFEVLMEGFPSTHAFWPMYHSLVGVLHEVLGNDDLAIEFHQKALDTIWDEPFLRYVRFRSYIHLSEIMKGMERYEDGLRYVAMAKKYRDPVDSVRSSYYINHYASFHHMGLGDYATAFDKQLAAIDLQKQLEYNKNALEISNLNVKFQTAEKEKQILREQQRAAQNRDLFVGAVLLLLLGGFIAVLIYKNSTKKRELAEQQEQIQKQKVETLLKEQELVSIDAMIAGQEKERRKVANELHDDLGSLMATIKLHFDNMKINKTDPALKNAQKLLDEAYQKIRSMAHAKNSGVMANQGLLPAVQKMAQTISGTNALAVTVEEYGLGERMENTLELTIFRVIQELIANIIKHAGATQASIQFTQHEDNLNIIVEDNGKGFDMARVEKTRSGMGLTTIEKRIEHLEGNFTVDSVLDKGTSILIDIPL